MFIQEIETSIKLKNTKNFLNIIKKLSVKDLLLSDHSGLSTIHICVKYDAMKELLMLLDSIPTDNQKEILNQKTKGLCPKTPLQIASESHNDRVTKFLIERGAEVTKQDIEKMAENFKQNPLFLSYLNELKEEKFKREKKFWFF